MKKFVLIIKDKFNPECDCKLFGNDYERLKLAGIDSVQVDPKNIKAEIWLTAKNIYLCNCNMLLESE